MSAGSTSDSRRIWTASNIITITRILLVPLFVAALLAPWPEWFGMNLAFSNDWKSIIAAGIFVLISCTDWLDGYLARSRNEVTDFGKFMDPLADKILVAAALICLVELGDLPTWVVLVILAREFIVSGIRMMAASKGVVIAASMLGKFKTVFQMIAIVLFTIKSSHMIGDFSLALSDTLWVVSWIVMLIAIALTIASMIDYLIKGKELIGFGDASQAGVGSTDEQMKASVQELAREVIEAAKADGKTIGTAESLTGGLIGSTLTSVPGSSEVYRGGVVSYTNEVKNQVLGVSQELLDEQGAVCAEVSEQMARGAREKLNCDIAISVTGIAGPGGEEPGKPVGTVWMGVCAGGDTKSRLLQLDGSRESIRLKTVEAALQELKALL